MSHRSKSLRITQEGEVVHCILSGDWINEHSSSAAWQSWREFWRNSTNSPQSCFFSMDSGLSWDSSLLVFFFGVTGELSRKGVSADLSRIPPKVKKLLDFIDQRRGDSLSQSSFPEAKAIASGSGGKLFLSNIFTYWGRWLQALANFLIGRSFMRPRDLLNICRDCGASALPIVTLISFLTGLTMAFVGSVQLEKFNASIYIADLVSLAMVREMGGLMVGIVMAGRTGASFAAELGSMKIREEIDSLRTFGIPAVDFLVLPRTLALFLMTPLLTLYADVIGILGGLTVGTQVMDFSSIHYWEQTESALTNMWEVYSGLIKSIAFGLIVGLVGCYKGLHTGSDSAALGKSVTSSVVISITLIVVCDAFFEVAFSFLGYR
jgi:phospholipid/cholesterol/gamma-HCH transport system permease protein